MINNYHVQTWEDLIAKLYEGSWQPELKHFRTNLAYRGLPEANTGLYSGLNQLAHISEQLEGHLLRNFRKYACHGSIPQQSVWNWLALAQHHGLPTRLIDWTYSPFVALHFATEDTSTFRSDACIWCVNYVRSNILLPENLRQILRLDGSQVFTTEMLQIAAPNLKDFDLLDEKIFAVFLEPPSFDDRIVNQFALFSLLSNPTLPFGQWLENHPELAHRVTIPAHLKSEIRDKLDQANITERVLFPGLDGTCKWLKRYYSAHP